MTVMIRLLRDAFAYSDAEDARLMQAAIRQTAKYFAG